jgi:twinkle protein
MAEFLTDDIDFESYMEATDAQAHVRPASEYTEALVESLRPKVPRKLIYLPWEKTRSNFGFREGEVTVWAGQNGHGKSHVSRVVALSLMGQGERVCIANFEAKPLTTLRAMSRMHSGVNLFVEDAQDERHISDVERAYRAFGAWSNGKLWLYAQTGTQRGNKVLGMAKYCAKELGMNHIFIDNLAKCIRDEDDMNGQKAFVDECCVMAEEFNTHIHILAHLRKPPNEYEKPDKSHVKGSGAIVDQPANLMLIWRNKPKEDERKVGGQARGDEPDAIVSCKKQREYEGISDGEPSIGLWLHRDSNQFVGAAHESPLNFEIRYPHRPVRAIHAPDPEWETA